MESSGKSGTNKVMDKLPDNVMWRICNKSRNGIAIIRFSCLSWEGVFTHCISLPISQRRFSSCSKVASITFFLSSHSHTVSTVQPSCCSSAKFLLSLSTFPMILGRQYSSFVLGHTNRGQSCLCQKQPFTKITVLYLGRTISGHPGSVLTFFLYRTPFENRYLRTNSSGFEFLLRICDMFMLRTSFEWLSAIFFLLNQTLR